MKRPTLALVATLGIAAAVSLSLSRTRPARPTAAPAAPDSVAALPGLTAPATIVTDRWGIPHVTAATRADLYRAWGFVTARDRLWQLESTRRAAEGRSWEWLGNRALRDDGGAQLLELAERAARAWAADSGDARARVPLQAFADGVNAYIALCRRGERAWPRGLIRLGREPEDWRPRDSYLVVYAQAMVLDFALPEIAEGDEIDRLGRDRAVARRRFEDRIQYVTVPDEPPVGARGGNGERPVRAPDAPGPPRADDLRHAGLPAGAGRPPGERGATVTSPPAPLAARASGIGPLERAARNALGERLAPFDPEARASNVFAVGPRRSASGRPLLANDPHVSLAVPSSFHAVHLTVPDTLDAAGVCAPGVPALISGRNRRCAWGVTSLGADVFDVYADSLSADARLVWTGRGWAPLEQRPFRMRFRLPGGLEVPLPGQVRRYTPHGAVVVWQPKRRRALSVRWTADEAPLTLAGALGLESSARVGEIASRIATLSVPVLNVVAADRDGAVLYRACGAVPARERDPGPGPLPGDGAHEWRGIVPAGAMPAWRAPPGGFVVNSNNRPVRTDWPAPWPRYGFAHDRALRIAERLSGDAAVTLDDMRSVQNDVLSRGARRIVPALLAAVAPARAASSPLARAALDTLAAWDGIARRDRVGPTLYRAWYGALLRRAGMESVPGLALASITGEVAGELLAPDGVAPETPAAATAAALDTALARLTAMLGPDLAGWTWGRAHQASFAHRLSALEPDLAVRGVPVDGDNSTVCVGRSSLPWSAAVTHGPAWRMLVDLADDSRAWVVLPPGNSGDAASRHDRDLLARWADHGYVPLLLDARDVARVAEGVTRLVPAAPAGDRATR